MLDRELDNYRAALDYGLEHDPVTALRTAAALGFFWSRRAAPSEGRFWLESAIARVEAMPAALEDRIARAAHARAYGWLGQTAMASGDNLSAGRDFARGAELAQATGDQRARSMAIGMLGFVELLSGDLEAAGPHLQEAVDIATRPRRPAHPPNGPGHAGSLLGHHRQTGRGPAPARRKRSRSRPKPATAGFRAWPARTWP